MRLCLALAALAAFLAFWLAPVSGGAQDFRALARIDPGASAIRDGWRGRIEIDLALTQAVPWRVALRDGPPRLVVDFREVQWSGVDLAALVQGARVSRVRTGSLAAGWSRLVAELDGPYTLSSAEMRTDPTEGSAVVAIELARAERPAFEAAVAASRDALPDMIDLPEGPAVRPRHTGERALRVVLDPGHGGVDMGAEYGGLRESDVMLQFAREVQEALLRRGGFEVVLTREDDSFISLYERTSVARAVGADVFISLHADAIAEGAASGATVYTLPVGAQDAASARLAETHSRDDLILGVDLEHNDDEVARLLMELTRREVAPRSAALADAMVARVGEAIGRLHKRPRLEAEFVVLKAPDIPSVLLEVGFMSDARDLANLQNPAWRARAALGIVNALEDWAISDAAEALRLRQ